MQHERRYSRACGADVSFRDVKIETPERKIDRGMGMTSWPEAWAEIWEKSVSWVPASERKSRVLASEEDGWLSELAEALRRGLHVVWGRWRMQIRKIVYLPPYVEKPFNSKVIKSFVPELWSRKCVSGFLCYLCMSYEHSMSISHIHIWLCNITNFLDYVEDGSIFLFMCGCVDVCICARGGGLKFRGNREILLYCGKWRLHPQY